MGAAAAQARTRTTGMARPVRSAARPPPLGPGTCSGSEPSFVVRASICPRPAEAGVGGEAERPSPLPFVALAGGAPGLRPGVLLRSKPAGGPPGHIPPPSSVMGVTGETDARLTRRNSMQARIKNPAMAVGDAMAPSWPSASSWARAQSPRNARARPPSHQPD